MIQFSPGVGGGGGGISQWAGGVVTAAGTMVYYGNAVFIANQAFTTGASFEADAINGYWSYINTNINNNNLMLSGFDFEDGDTGGWTAVGCATVTNGFPASVGSGAAAFSAANGGRTKGANTTAPAVVSSGQLNGKYSLNYATSGAGTIGDMYISQAIPIPISMQAKVLQIKFKYKSVTGAPVLAGDATNTYAVAVYDMVNNIWIQPAGCFNIVQGSGVGTYTGTIQTSSNSTNLQIAVYNPIAPVGASSFYVDDFYFGEQITASGAAISDFKTAIIGNVIGSTSGTLAIGTGGGATYSAVYKQIGDEAIVKYTIRIGTAGTADVVGAYVFPYPTGLVSSSSISYEAIGYGEVTNMGTANPVARMTAKSYSTTSFIIDTSDSALLSNAGILYNNTNQLTVTIRIKVVGWSSNTVMSADMDTRVVEASYAMTTGFTVGTSATLIKFDTMLNDTHGSYSTSTGLYTASSTGVYRISGQFQTAAITVATNASAGTLIVYKNGSPFRFIDTKVGTGGLTNNYTISGSTEISLNAGETVALWGSQGTSGNISGVTLNYFTISKLSGPATIAASESVNVEYSDSAGTYGATGAIVATTMNTKEIDTHNAFNGTTGVFTAPVSGTYLADVQLAPYFSTASTGNFSDLFITSSGTSSGASSRNYSNGVASAIETNICIKSFRLNTGQTLTFTKSATFSSGTATQFASTTWNRLTITRTGN